MEIDRNWKNEPVEDPEPKSEPEPEAKPEETEPDFELPPNFRENITSLLSSRRRRNRYSSLMNDKQFGKMLIGIGAISLGVGLYLYYKK